MFTGSSKAELGLPTLKQTFRAQHTTAIIS